MADPKGIAALILKAHESKGASPMGPVSSPEDEVSEPGDSPDEEGQEAACQEMMSAIESKDVEAFKEALKSFLQIVQ